MWFWTYQQIGDVFEFIKEIIGKRRNILYSDTFTYKLANASPFHSISLVSCYKYNKYMYTNSNK